MIKENGITIPSRFITGNEIYPSDTFERVGVSTGGNEVYRAIWTQDPTQQPRSVLIKRLALSPDVSNPNRRGNNPHLRWLHTKSRLIAREDEILRKVNSVGVGPVCHGLIEGFASDGTRILSLVMDEIVGENLHTAIIRFQERSIGDRAKIAQEIGVDVLSDLVQIQKLGLVHRDIKPSNIILTATSARLIDYEIAAGEQEYLAMDEDLKNYGTPGYLAPEQATFDRTATVGTMTDPYALALVLYEVMTGPRHASAYEDFVQESDVIRTAEQNILLVTGAIADGRIPIMLGAILLRALQPRKENRYPNAQAMLDELLAVGPF